MPDGLALYYSVTANPYEPLLNFLGRYVDGFRIVSRGELERLQARRARRNSDDLRRPGQARRRARGRDRGRRDDQRRERRRGAPRDPRRREASASSPKIAVRVNPPFAIEDGRITIGARPSPFGVDAERVPALVQGLLEAGVDWRGLHMFAGAQCLDDDGA